MTNLMNLGDINTMSSREIAELTEKRHDHVLRDCEVLNKNYTEMGFPKLGESNYIADNGHTYREYLLSKMQTLDLMTGYRIDLRIKVNRRWEQLETNGQKTIADVTKSDLARLIIQSEEEKEYLQLQLEAQAPIVEYHNEVLDATNSMSMTSIAKGFGMSAQRLNQILKVNRIQYKRASQWFLYAKYQNEGYTKSIPTPYTDPNTNEIRTKQETRWTEKGKRFIYKFLIELGIISNEELTTRERSGRIYRASRHPLNS